jgi:hypothetical protein
LHLRTPQSDSARLIQSRKKGSRTINRLPSSINIALPNTTTALHSIHDSILLMIVMLHQ